MIFKITPSFYLLIISLFIPKVHLLASDNTKNLQQLTRQWVKGNHQGFIENKGQIVDQNYSPNPEVKYLLCNPGFNVQLRQTGFSYDTYVGKTGDVRQETRDGRSKNDSLPEVRYEFHRVDIELTGCNPNSQMVTEGKSEMCFNYYTAGTPQGGVHNVHTYEKVIYKDIYPNIDLKFYTSSEYAVKHEPSVGKLAGVEYEFVIHPGGNVNDIQLLYNGADDVREDNDGLSIKVAFGTFTENIPRSYITGSGEDVEVHYKTTGRNLYSYEVLSAGKSITSDLVIDPIPNLSWASYYGGTGDDDGWDIALGVNDTIYITGYTNTNTAGVIATSGAYQTKFAGGAHDAFVAKFNPGGTALLWGTYYGGTADDKGYGIAVDKNDNAYITGYTQSGGIATPGAYQTAKLGSPSAIYNAFAAKLNANGDLVWSTYYGGFITQAFDIALDAGNNVYIAGYTAQTTSPLIASPGAYHTFFGGGGAISPCDAFIAKINSAGTALVWGTYYGGGGNEVIQGIAVDGSSNNVYVTGYTSSSDSIATPGGYRTVYSGGSTYGDPFVAKFNSTGTVLTWGTYYGGYGDDSGNRIVLGTNDTVYITGFTYSSTGISTAGAYQFAYAGGGNSDAFAAKFNPVNSALIWGTYYGGTGTEVGSAIALDATNNVYITGFSTSTTGIASSAAYQTLYKGSDDVFVTKFNSAGSALLWGTYYGGTSDEQGLGIAVDASDNVFVTGFTGSAGIATAGAYQVLYGGGAGPNDAFVAEFTAVLPLITPSGPTLFCEGDSVILNANASYSSYLWLPGGATTRIITVKTSGTYSLTAINNLGGDTTSSITITVNPLPSIAVTPSDVTICQGSSVQLSASGAVSYSWLPDLALNNNTSPAVTADPSTYINYTVTGTDINSCSGQAAVSIFIYPLPTLLVSSNVTICRGDSTELSASGATTFQWSPAVNPSTGALVRAGPAITTTYTVTGTDVNNCQSSAAVQVAVTTIQLMVSPNVTITAGSSTSVSVTGGDGSYLWTPANGLSCNTCYNPTANPMVTTTYYVTVKNSPGCSQIDSVVITVKRSCGDSSIVLPNIFTPNGDNQNDIYYVKTDSECIRSMNFQIYDRWGTMVFESSDPGIGWDGKYKGKELDAGVFMYWLKITDTIGNTTSKEGNLFLVK